MLAMSLRWGGPDANPAVQVAASDVFLLASLNAQVKRLSKLTEKTGFGLCHVYSVNRWQPTLTTEKNLGALGIPR
jgi:hypothetical protein